MAAETHVIEIPINDNDTTNGNESSSSSQQCRHVIIPHPLTEISESPGHLLLLKLYQREEDRVSRRVGEKETRIDSIKREAFRVSSLFFSFHAVFLTLLFVVSVDDAAGSDGEKACKNWWVPSCLSLFTSAVLVSSVQVRVREYWRVLGQLRRERAEGRALARCIQEMRTRGASFDLSREPQAGKKRVKSSSVEGGWRPLRWMKENLVTMSLLTLAGLLVPACKFMLCS